MEIRNLNRDARAGFTNEAEFSLKKKFDSVVFKVSQGSVSRDGKFMKFYPAHSGKDTIAARFYFKNKLVHTDTTIFDVIAPEVFPLLNSGGELLWSRKISLPVLKAVGGATFFIRVNDYHWETISIQSYRFSLIRKGQCLYSEIQNSYQFSAELITKFDTLIPEDIILISEIVIGSEHQTDANILPGVFEIK